MEDLLEQTWTCASCSEARADEDDRNGTVDGDVCEPCRDEHYSWCEDCDETVHNDDVRWLNDGDKVVCDDCIDRHYTSCDSCGDYASNDDIYRVDGDDYCYGCYDDLPYCDRCGERYTEANASDHNHGGGCGDDCNPLPLAFTIGVSDGSDTVGADEPFTVTMPGGVIPVTVRRAVQTMLREAAGHNGQDPLWAASLYVHSVGAEWKTDKGTYPKRLRREVYNRSRTEMIQRRTGAIRERHYNYAEQRWGYELGPWMPEEVAKRSAKGYSLPDEIVAKIGAMCEPYSRPVNMEVQATRDINGGPEDFCHDGSCWWGDEEHSRCTLKINGGFGLRTFDEEETTYHQFQDGTWIDMPHTETVCSGRAWVLPLRRHEVTGRWQGVTGPVLDSTTVEAWAVFNGYGTLSEQTAAQIVSKMTGLPSKRVDADRDDWNMWVNSGAYIVAEQAVLDTLPNCLYLGLTAHY